MKCTTLAAMAMMLAACSPKPQTNSEKVEYYAKCSAIFGRIYADIGRLSDTLAAKGVSDKDERSKKAADKSMNMSVAYFEKAAALSSKVEAGRKMAKYAEEYTTLFRSDIAKNGNDEEYRKRLFADGDECR